MNRRPVICFGDSITHAQAASELGRWTGLLATRLETHSSGQYEVFNRGIGGNTTQHALDRLHHEVRPLLPGIVLLEFGINDAYVFPWAAIPRISVAEYRRNLGEITRQIQLHKGTPVWIINHVLTERTDLHPQGNGQSIGYNLLPYNSTLKEFIHETQGASIDLPERLQATGHDPDALLSPDGIHLSPSGNSLYSELVFNGLKPLLDPAGS